ncbi:hypothetical protein SAMN04488518_106184 [Pseudovibrio ascidiaceicola]|uniref:Uncharacterized protein n=1 Tax=Pseudovibrio ascidiaceicola TaxID=285279 RepID=A0A1I4AFL8_9HYPH|nr:hypothetical protein SAMN04488518_106184 [Pseudovibrio ascidiaceicola]
MRTIVRIWKSANAYSSEAGFSLRMLLLKPRVGVYDLLLNYRVKLIPTAMIPEKSGCCLKDTNWPIRIGTARLPC